MELKVTRNRLGVINNTYQGNALRVLTVCSAGCLRSPTAATLLSCEPFNFNTRSCGIDTDFAIVPISAALLLWAEVIVVMESWMGQEVDEMLTAVTKENRVENNKEILCLDIPDDFGFMDEELQRIMLGKFNETFKHSDLN